MFTSNDTYNEWKFTLEIILNFLLKIIFKVMTINRFMLTNNDNNERTWKAGEEFSGLFCKNKWTIHEVIKVLINYKL